MYAKFINKQWNFLVVSSRKKERDDQIITITMWSYGKRLFLDSRKYFMMTVILTSCFCVQYRAKKHGRIRNNLFFCFLLEEQRELEVVCYHDAVLLLTFKYSSLLLLLSNVIFCHCYVYIRLNAIATTEQHDYFMQFFLIFCFFFSFSICWMI